MTKLMIRNPSGGLSLWSFPVIVTALAALITALVAIYSATQHTQHNKPSSKPDVQQAKQNQGDKADDPSSYPEMESLKVVIDFGMTKNEVKAKIGEPWSGRKG